MFAEDKEYDYQTFQMRLEALVDALIYHPKNQQRYRRRYKTGFYQRRFRRLRGLSRRLFGSLDGFQLYCCGVSHLDAAWLFPAYDGKIRAYKTFYKAVENCERYPFLTFSQTSPQYYAWIKRYAPELWIKVKEKVAEGRIELSGGMWVEPSLDMVAGEVLVRQRLYGQLFFLREFGFYPTMASLLDVFGFPWSFPQILVKSGATSFWTTKDTGAIPFNTFVWQGIDGTRIFTFQNTYNWDALFSLEGYKNRARYPKLGKEQTILNSHMTYAEMQECFSKKPTDYNPLLPLFYGLGDGGRGPLELEIIYADTLAQIHNGIHGNQHDFMERLKESTGDRYVIWNDEKYLRYHRGVKTTQVMVKHLNRLAELYATTAESFLTWVNLLPNQQNFLTFSKAKLFKIWEKVLFNQFHDILPGSSIPEVYVQAHKELRQAIRGAQAFIEKAFKHLLQGIEVSESEVLVFNPFSWKRSEYFYHNDKWLFIENIPPLSVKKYHLEDLTTEVNSLEMLPTKDELVLENAFIRAEFHPTGGGVISLKSKATNQELIAPEQSQNKEGSGFRVYYEDPDEWKAWNLDKRYPLNPHTVRVKSGPNIIKNEQGVTCIKTVYEFLNSSASTSFFLRPHDKMLQLEMQTDLKDPETLVKYFIPLTLKNENVTCEIPFATIDRKRVFKTEMEKDKWEFNMQKWFDISDSEGGLAVLNNNRYGFSANKLGIYLTITRTPLYPDVSPLYGATRFIPAKYRPKYTDLRPYEYRFGLLPHGGCWTEARVWEDAFNFNLPLFCHQGASERSKHDSVVELPEEGLINIDQPNIRITALKYSEWVGDKLDQLLSHEEWGWNGKSFILRLVEMEGQDTQFTLRFRTRQISSITEVDLLEMNPEPVSEELKDNVIQLSIGHHEIKTYRLVFA